MLEVAASALIPGHRDDDLDSRVLPKILRWQAERLGSDPFIDICGRSASFEEMWIASARLVRGLRKLGIRKGDRVAMLLPNCFELVATWFAAACLGAIEVPSTSDLLLLHRGRGVTAGYPVLAVVTGAGLDTVAQLRPGDVVRFRRSTLEAASRAHLARHLAVERFRERCWNALRENGVGDLGVGDLDAGSLGAGDPDADDPGTAPLGAGEPGVARLSHPGLVGTI